MIVSNPERSRTVKDVCRPATNRWLGEKLHMGGLHEVSRRLSAWQRQAKAAKLA